MKKQRLLIVFCALMAWTTIGATGDIRPVPFTKVHVDDSFWRQRLDVLQQRTIRYAFKKCDEAGQIDNFRIAGQILSGELKQGEVAYRSGTTYDDAEVYKVIEGAAYLLNVQRDAELEAYVDSVVNLICSAQEPDGYLFTNWTIANPLHEWMGGARWKNDWNLSHETFDLGELIEAGVAYYQATGKDQLLNAARRAADLMCEVFREGGMNEAPGHAVVEMALVRLYEATGDRKYLDECKYFLDTRGSRTFDSSSADLRVNGRYWQNHMPVVQQREAVGHAVRAMYLYSGMADWALHTGDKECLEAIDAIYESIVGSKMYITGGLGARDENEAFGVPYELPNATAYCETCASVAGCMFGQRMFRLHGQARYFDFVERMLYNNVLDGMSIRGDRFFYPNRLETDSRGQERSEWFGTSCCPTNLSRFIPSMPGYVYATSGNTLYVNLFVGSTSEIELDGGSLTLTQTTDYPWEGLVAFTVDRTSARRFEMRLRIPGWALGQPIDSNLYTYVGPPSQRPTISINGTEVDYTMTDGYAVLNRKWRAGDRVELRLPMEVRQVKAHDAVVFNTGRLAVERGPLVYCAEFADNDGAVSNLAVPRGAVFRVDKPVQQLFADMRVITADGRRLVTTPSGCSETDAQVRFIPYFARSYRGRGEMRVWMAEQVSSPFVAAQNLDSVDVGNAASEQAHNLQGEHMSADADAGWRDAREGWVAYTLAVDPDHPCELVLRHDGNAAGRLEFDIYADGVKFAYDSPNRFMPNSYYDMSHPIPLELTRGKRAVAIRLQARQGNSVPRLYGVRTVRNRAMPLGAKVEDWLLPSPDAFAAHSYASNGGTGVARERVWADGRGVDGLSFDVAVSPTAANTLMMMYWGSEVDLRQFDILVDGESIASESLLHNSPGRYFFRTYAIPTALTAGKRKVRVALSSPTGTKVGGFCEAISFSNTR